jgi:hypothetical protein
MSPSIHTKRAHPPRACLLIAAAVVSAAVVAGCGGSSPNPTTASGGSTGSKSSAASASSSGPSAGAPGALAFARCMRANGVPNFPDPTPGGGFAFQAAVSSPALKGAQAKCQKLLPGGGPPGPGSKTHPSAQTLGKLLKIAECMRTHGVPQFPDPRTSVPSNPVGIREITDFDDAILLFPSTINMQAPAYRQALSACGAPPLGLRH